MNIPRFRLLEMERDDRINLVNRLSADSEWNLNFIVLLSCSVIIAGLGLMQNSGAVVIGAMLVAPLMTPLIGIGLALVQGNFHLLKNAFKSVILGVFISVCIGVIIELLTPHWELSQEITARAGPNILDLFIAFFAGISAAYAIARPNLSGALPGVAISVALVPPITVTGIALGSLDIPVAQGAGILFVTNMVAIIIGSACVFWAHGLAISRGAKVSGHSGLNRIIIGLACVMLFLMLPLGYSLDEQLSRGQTRPLAYPLSYGLFAAINKRLAEEEGVSYLIGGRPGTRRTSDVVIWLKADGPVQQSLVDDLKQISNRWVKGEEPVVVALQSAPVISGNETSGTESLGVNGSVQEVNHEE